MKICCVIVTYNIGKQILNTYNAVKNQVNQVIFVDNDSNNETKEIIEEICATHENCEVIFNDKNEGIAKALNIGINESINKFNADFILTLDHDSVAAENMISKMMQIYEVYEKKQNIAILCPAVYDINKKDYLTEVNNNEFQLIKEPIQSGSLIRKEVFKNVGLYNEELFIYYVDTDLCYRALSKGYNMVQCNKAVLYHEEGKKVAQKIGNKIIYYNQYSSAAVYYRARNHIYMLKNYFKPFTSKNRLIIDFIKILIFDCNKLGKIKFHLKGIFDGIRLFIVRQK